MNVNDFKLTITETLSQLKGTAYALTRPNLTDWLNRGFISASIESPGRGKPAYFTLFDLYKLGIFIFLVRQYGLSREGAKTIISEIGKSFDLAMKNGNIPSFKGIESDIGEVFIYLHSPYKFDGSIPSFFTTAFLPIRERKEGTKGINRILAETIADQEKSDWSPELSFYGIQIVYLQPIVHDLNIIFITKQNPIYYKMFSEK